MNAIEFTDIHRSYRRGEEVLDGVTFAVAPGQVVGLIGKNGAGKTTLLRIALGLLEAQGGRVRVLGLDPRRAAVEVKRRLGYVAEDQILPSFLKVGEILSLHRSLFPTWDDAMAQTMRERFEIPLDKRIRDLSKGKRPVARPSSARWPIDPRSCCWTNRPAGSIPPPGASSWKRRSSFSTRLEPRFSFPRTT